MPGRSLNRPAAVMPDERQLKEKQRVAAAFNRAARGYDRIAQFQWTVAEQVLERLEFMRIDPRVVVDLGAGTGRAAEALAKRYRHACVLEVDAALDMLRTGRPRGWRRWRTRRRPLCADAEQLPLAPASADLVFSSLMLQWCNDPDAAFAEVHRVLRPGGLFIFSTLGPDTLMELRESWAAADGAVHVNEFIDMHDLGDGLVRAGLADPVMEVDRFTLTYGDVRALMRDLKNLGAGNANAGRRRTMTGKGRLQHMLAAYEAVRAEGRLPATYEVVFGHAWRADTVPQRERGVAVVPVAAIGRRRHAGPGPS